jgi:hypothetical protein
MEVMAVTVDIIMGMAVVIVDMVIMVITKHVFVLSIETLKIVQEYVLLQSVFGTSIYLLTLSHNIRRCVNSVSES